MKLPRKLSALSPGTLDLLGGAAGATVTSVLLEVWPPSPDETPSQLEAAVLLGLDTLARDSTLYLSSDEGDGLPVLQVREDVELRSLLSGDTFEPNMRAWRREERDAVMDFETYDMTTDDRWKNIVGEQIVGVSVIWLKYRGAGIDRVRSEFVKPVGTYIEFREDYLISSSGWNGNTVETWEFRYDNILARLLAFGAVEFVPVDSEGPRFL